MIWLYYKNNFEVSMSKPADWTAIFVSKSQGFEISEVFTQINNIPDGNWFTLWGNKSRIGRLRQGEMLLIAPLE